MSVDICALPIEIEGQLVEEHLVILVNLSFSGKTSQKIHHVSPFKNLCFNPERV